MFVRKSPRRALLTLLAAALLLASCGGGATPVPTADINAINTAAVSTALAQLSAQFTQTALAAPSSAPLPTNTPVSLPTFALPTAGNATANPGALPTVSFNTTPVAGITQLASPLPPAGATAPLGDACNNNVFEGDLTIPDGTILKPGEDFTKVWQVKNTGNCTWDDGYALVFIAGDRKIDPVDLIFTTDPGVDFIAPGESADFDIKLTAPLAEGPYEGHWRMRDDRGFYFGTILSVYFEVRK